MECNITKQNVYVTETVLNQNLEQPIDTEFTLPDYCPDIDRIIKCVIRPRCGQKSFNGDTLTVDGTAELSLYYTDGNQIRCHEHFIRFSRQISAEKTLNNPSAMVTITTEYVNCRAVSKRRVDVHASLNMSVCITSLTEHEVISDIDCPSVQTLPFSAEATTPMGVGEKYILFSDEVEIPSTHGALKTLLRTDSRAIASDCKIIGNKVVVKGELIVEFFYISDNDDKPEHFSTVLPISQIVDVDRVNDTCTATAKIEINEFEVKTHTSAAGEVSMLTVSAKMTVTASAFCNLDVPVLLDAYSTDFGMELEKREICFKKVDNTIYKDFSCRGNIDFGADEIKEIVDIWCEPKLINTDVNKNGVFIKGITNVNVLAIDVDGYPRYYEKTFEFEHEHKCDAENCEITTPQIVVSGIDCSLVSNSAEIKIDFTVHAEIICIKEITALCEAKLSENEIKPKDDFARIVLYYPNEKEKLWDIARRYNTEVSDIKSINGITGDFVEKNSVVLVPQK